MKSIYFLSKILDCEMIWLKSRIYNKKEYKRILNEIEINCYINVINLFYYFILLHWTHYHIIQWFKKEKRQNRI